MSACSAPPRHQCTFPHTCVPFHCSGELCCAFFHLHRPIHDKPSHTSGLRRSAGARVFVFSCSSTWCAFPCMRIPFRCSGGLCCSGRLRCAFFHSRGPIYSVPACISALRCCARVCIFTPFCRPAWVRACATFHCISRVGIYWE